MVLIFTLLSMIFGICCFVVQPPMILLNNNDNNTCEVDDKLYKDNRANFVMDRGYVLFTSADLMGNYFIWGLLNRNSGIPELLPTDSTNDITYYFTSTKVNGAIGIKSTFDYQTTTLTNQVNIQYFSIHKFDYWGSWAYEVYFYDYYDSVNQNYHYVFGYFYVLLSSLNGGQYGTNVPLFACGYGPNTDSYTCYSENLNANPNAPIYNSIMKGLEDYGGGEYADGYREGYSEAQNFYEGRIIDVRDNAYTNGYNEGIGEGYQSGYTAGYNEGASIDDTASTIFTGFMQVGLLPVNVFLSMLQYEVFGINIAGLVSSLLTVSIVIIIIRFLFGGKKDD